MTYREIIIFKGHWILDHKEGMVSHGARPQAATRPDRALWAAGRGGPDSQDGRGNREP